MPLPALPVSSCFWLRLRGALVLGEVLRELLVLLATPIREHLDYGSKRISSPKSMLWLSSPDFLRVALVERAPPAARMQLSQPT